VVLKVPQPASHKPVVATDDTPGSCSLDGALSGTELWEARGASRGNTFPGKSAVSLSLRFGLRSMYFLTNFLLITVNAQHQNLRFGLLGMGFFLPVSARAEHQEAYRGGLHG